MDNLYVDDRTPAVRKENRVLLWPILGVGVAFLALWLVLAFAFLLQFRESPLEGWTNLHSRVMTGLSVAWTIMAIVYGYLMGVANAPPILTIGEDFLEGAPLRRYPQLGGKPRLLHIDFHMIRRIGWTIYGPAVLTNQKGPPGFGILVTSENARALNEQWQRWKDHSSARPFRD